MIQKKTHKQGLFYRTLRAYELFLNDCFFYKKVHRIGKENIPPDGTPVLFVSNHQNCLCDPLSVIFTVTDRKINMFVRADIFAIHPWLTKFFNILAMNPAYRLDVDGKDLLSKNMDMFKKTEVKILDGESALMYPEGRHQGKNWLGDFTFGYTKLAFETAALGDFQTDIWIQPCCNHYSSYRDIQQEVIVEFGKPVSLKSYYELYKEKPRTAQRQVNELVRQRVCDMILHIPDLKNYKAIDFLRNTTCGRQFAERQGFKADYLPDKLHADQLFVKKLHDAMQNDGAAQTDTLPADGAASGIDKNTATIQTVYEDALTVESRLKKLKIRDDQFDKRPGWGSIILSAAALVVLFPAWVFSLWPNIFIYKIPDLLMRRIKDKMFHNSFLFVSSSLLTMPLFYTLTFVLVWIFMNVWVALIYALALPWLGLFAYRYGRLAVKTMQNIRFRRVAKTDEGRKLRDLRNSLVERLNQLIE
jgi:1-acyl-sn-glycerol-3-phosphate acyltransferase